MGEESDKNQGVDTENDDENWMTDSTIKKINKVFESRKLDRTPDNKVKVSNVVPLDMSSTHVTPLSTVKVQDAVHEDKADKTPRQKRMKTLTVALRSPYMRRVVLINVKREKTEDFVATYIFSGWQKLWDNLFTKGTGMTVKRTPLESLRPGVWIQVDVLFAWAAVLNNEERYQRKGTPGRMFCMPMMLVKRFRANMEIVLKGTESKTVKDYRLVFVPIIYEKHYYMMSFDLQTCDVLLIDNGAVDVVDFSHKYQNRPQKMVVAFSGYLNTVGHPSALKLRTSKPVQLEFPWRTMINSVDCGVFLMWHMETYKGTTVKDWECGLSKEKNNKGEWSSRQNSELEDLRHKYVAKILLSEIKTLKHVVEGKVQMFGGLSEAYKKKLEATTLSKIIQRLDSV